MNEDKKEIQIIHKTEFIDKELPTIFYKKQNLESMSNGTEETISISDKTSKEALETFKKLIKEIK